MTKKKKEDCGQELNIQNKNNHNNKVMKGTQNEKSKWMRVRIRQKRHMIVLVWTLWFTYMSLTSPVESKRPLSEGHFTADAAQERSLLSKNSNHRFKRSDPPLLRLEENVTTSDSRNCTPPTFLDFPTDLFTQQERRHGAVLVHFIVSLYIFYALAIVCDDYFVPSIEAIVENFNIPSDVAGATFMAIASSSPELFTNTISTFITEGDIGAGTIVGSAVFNILAICACCGFAAKKALPIDWYPLARDSVFYFVACALLIRVLGDGRIYFLEAFIFVSLYVVYIIVMLKNAEVKNLVYRLIERIRRKYCSTFYSNYPQFESLLTEKSPLIKGSQIITNEEKDERKIINDDPEGQDDGISDDEEESLSIFTIPRDKSGLVWLDWVVGWPARLIFYLTVPDCKTDRFRRFFLLTLVMCVVHIGILTYIVTWMMEIIGHTFGAPDSIMGITLIAAGNSVPEAVSSIVVARKGFGSMSISNSLGSNTFDVLICLGLPWLIRTFMITKDPVNYVQINSGGLEYCAMFLMASIIFLFVILACNKFYLDRKVATISLLTYGAFIIIASLTELNVFTKVNMPSCVIPNE